MFVVVCSLPFVLLESKGRQKKEKKKFNNELKKTESEGDTTQLKEFLPFPFSTNYNSSLTTRSYYSPTVPLLHPHWHTFPSCNTTAPTQLTHISFSHSLYIGGRVKSHVHIHVITIAFPHTLLLKYTQIHSIL